MINYLLVSFYFKLTWTWLLSFCSWKPAQRNPEHSWFDVCVPAVRRQTPSASLWHRLPNSTRWEGRKRIRCSFSPAACHSWLPSILGPIPLEFCEILSLFIQHEKKKTSILLLSFFLGRMGVVFSVTNGFHRRFPLYPQTLFTCHTLVAVISY